VTQRVTDGCCAWAPPDHLWNSNPLLVIPTKEESDSRNLPIESPRKEDSSFVGMTMAGGD
jgi:hypothetical protein